MTPGANDEPLHNSRTNRFTTPSSYSLRTPRVLHHDTNNNDRYLARDPTLNQASSRASSEEEIYRLPPELRFGGPLPNCSNYLKNPPPSTNIVLLDTHNDYSSHSRKLVAQEIQMQVNHPHQISSHFLDACITTSATVVLRSYL